MEETKKNSATNSDMSKSKQKRIDRQKQESKKKIVSLTWKIVGAVIAVAIVALVAWGITSAVIKQANTITPSKDYSRQLKDNGYVKGVNPDDYIELCDYRNLVIPKAEIEYTDAQVDEDIATALENHKVLKTEDIEVKDGDTVNIDYVGTIDGVEFEGGNSNGAGSDLEIGSGTFIDDFEQQLIGAKPGEVVMVEVTFPEDYATAELAGKDAEFATTINGVYIVPEFDDDFVCANYSTYADTAEGYRQYLKDTNYEDAFNSYVENFIAENTIAKKYPKKFLKNFKETTMNQEQQSYEYMNQMYQQYYGQSYDDFFQYMGVTEEGYYEQLDTECKDKTKVLLAYQDICEKEGIEISEDELKEYVMQMYGGGNEDTYNDIVAEYGKGYIMLDLIKDKAMEAVKGYATVQ